MGSESLEPPFFEKKERPEDNDLGLAEDDIALEVIVKKKC